MPDIDGDIITDMDAIACILQEHPYWFVQDDYARIMWSKETGRYRIFTDYAGDQFIDGKSEVVTVSEPIHALESIRFRAIQRAFRPNFVSENAPRHITRFNGVILSS